MKLLRAEELEQDDALATLGPEAWPDPPALGELLDGARPLHTLLRDQRMIAGIGRSWVDEILWARRAVARTSAAPTSTGTSRSGCGRRSSRLLGAAIAHYERTIRLPIPDKLPMPLRVHRHEGEPCPRCGATLRRCTSRTT